MNKISGCSTSPYIIITLIKSYKLNTVWMLKTILVTIKINFVLNLAF